MNSFSFSSIQEYMPLPPINISGDGAGDDTPKLQFSSVECLMYTFHQIARRCPHFLTAEQNADRLKDFRLRYILILRYIEMRAKLVLANSYFTILFLF